MNLARHSLHLTLGALLLAGSGSAFPASCFVVGLSEDARIVDRSGVALKPTLLQQEGCEQFRVVSGRVHVYFAIDAGPQDREVSAQNPLLPVEAVRASSPFVARWKEMLSQVGNLLRGRERVSNGDSRSSSPDALRAALPTGKLAPTAVDLDIELPLGESEFLTSFRLVEEGKSLAFEARHVGQHLRIPASMLKSGSRYRWTASTDAQTFEGEFTVEQPSAAPALTTDSTPGAAEDKYLKAFRSASALLEDGHSYDARQVLKSALH